MAESLVESKGVVCKDQAYDVQQDSDSDQIGEAVRRKEQVGVVDFLGRGHDR